MPYSDIIDNRDTKLRDEVNALLGSSDEAKIAVGYLYLSGFYQIAEKLGELEEVRIISGNTLQRETVEVLAQSLASEDELVDAVEAGKVQKKSVKEGIVNEVAEAITRNLQALPHSADRERNIRRLSEFIKTGNVKIKVYTKHPLHAKAYIFKYKKEHAEANRAEGIGIVGSSNLTISGFHHNTELNTYVRGQVNYEELKKWFDALWDEAVPFNELLAERFDSVDSATSETGEEIPRKAAFFAPVANNYSGPKSIDIMVATDVLSEGYNLQDASIVVNYDLPVRLIQRAGRVDRIGSGAEIIHIKNFLPVDRVEKELNLKGILRKRIEEIHKHIGEDNRILEEGERLNEDAMYCIYERKEMDEIEQDDMEFSFDEAESLIKQLEKDRPEYMALIKKMQLGIRSAKTGKKLKGTYAFFRAGDIAKLMVQTPEGRIVDDFSEVINEIRCEKDCTEASVNEEQKEKYFGDLEGLRKVFKDAISKERLRLRPHSEVLKTKKRLQDMMGLFSSQEVR